MRRIGFRSTNMRSARSNLVQPGIVRVQAIRPRFAINESSVRSYGHSVDLDILICERIETWRLCGVCGSCQHIDTALCAGIDLALITHHLVDRATWQS